MSCLWLVLCRVCGMFYGLNWEDIVVGGKGLFLGRLRVKTMCTGVTKELSGMLLHGWARNCNLRYTIAWVSTQFRSPCTLSNLQH